jgi:sulfatase-modifying factor enzyme 1
MARLCSSLLLSLVIASSASAVTMAWTPIGNSGNACDPQPDTGAGAGCFGAVSYNYSIGTYEVTNAQYAEFLNAKAAADPHALYSSFMGGSFGGITQSGSSGSYTYTPIAGRESWPVNYVGFYDAARFANWMNNGQGAGDTESGAYTLLGPNGVPTNDATVTRNAGATIVVTSEDEWYKAAYYDPATSSYFDYPAGFDAQTNCSAPTGTVNHANCGIGTSSPVPTGSYPGSPSPYGTFDQGGNLWEWNETSFGEGYRGVRGGAFSWPADTLAASDREYADLYISSLYSDFGFRIAMIPEPSTNLLVIAGLLALGVRHRMNA